MGRLGGHALLMPMLLPTVVRALHQMPSSNLVQAGSPTSFHRSFSHSIRSDLSNQHVYSLISTGNYSCCST
ncbi:hypothetical protein C8F04DRAFT_446951 [Mycena alexandri]|uniref:Secreted protein n=1 Tax=Mycena alexandri TaxID=1745969 RepID=A0AAD6TI40_9AGAR|nr:hypothetical protein C8F04DRAFT_446951 [Mycena alexandri]